ncbi:MAG: ABC transporter ATP-binding protein [Pseudomonadota bacterium]
MLHFFKYKNISHLISNYFNQLKIEDIELFINIFNQYFYRFRFRYLVIFILVFITAGSTAVIAWFIKDVVNVVFVNKQADLIIPIFLFIFIIFVTKGVSTYFQMVLSRHISNAMVADVQQRLFDHLTKQRISYFNKITSDDLMMRFSQGAHGFYSILTTVVVDGSREAAMVIGLFVVMLIQDPLLTLLCFTVVPVVFYAISTLVRKIKNAAKQELEGFSDLNKNIRELVQGISVIKAFHLENFMQRKTHKIIKDIQDQRNQIAVLQSAPVPLMDTLGGLAVGLTILYVGFRVVSGDYDPGTFMSFITALLLAADAARRLSQLPVKLKTALTAVGMVFELLNDKQYEISGANTLFLVNGTALNQTEQANGHEPISKNLALEPQQDPLIRFQDVTFSYCNQKPILNAFDLDIQPGEMIAIVGPSGSGKSTLFKLLLKFYEPTSGTISINGTSLDEIDLLSLRSAISLVEQSNFIFSGSIADNITLGDKTVSQHRIEQACHYVGLHDFISSQPNGYDADVGELGAMISGGQAQRLNMARAIIKDTPILLLDEVTSALDTENEILIKDYVHSQAGDKTILIIAHRLSTVKDADRIVLLENGQVSDCGSHKELLSRNAYYENIVRLQFAQ